MAREASASLTFALFGVHPTREILVIGWRTRNSIAVAEPLQQVPVLTAGAAERSAIDRLGPAADRAALGFSSFRHIRRTWEGLGLAASRRRRPLGAKVPASSRRVPPEPRPRRGARLGTWVPGARRRRGGAGLALRRLRDPAPVRSRMRDCAGGQ